MCPGQLFNRFHGLGGAMGCYDASMTLGVAPPAVAAFSRSVELYIGRERWMLKTQVFKALLHELSIFG